jgi:spore maturation protein CgeB
LRDFGSDVSYVGNHSAHKEEVLDSLAKLFPEIKLRIWGYRWRQRCASDRLKKYIVGMPVEGSSYAKTLQASCINLSIMYGIVYGASQGDETSNRTYEIPACGGFMLHERTPEVLERYYEDKEIACFSSTEELVEKLRHYLAHPAQREELVRAGHARCVPAYSFDSRMRQVISWHEEHSVASGLAADPGVHR